MVDYTLLENDQNLRICTLGTVEERKEFKKNFAYLELGHVYAWHKASKRNVIVFHYEKNNYLISCINGVTTM